MCDLYPLTAGIAARMVWSRCRGFRCRQCGRGADSVCVDGVGGDIGALVGRHYLLHCRHHHAHLSELVADDGVVGSRRRFGIGLTAGSGLGECLEGDRFQYFNVPSATVLTASLDTLLAALLPCASSWSCTPSDSMLSSPPSSQLLKLRTKSIWLSVDMFIGVRSYTSQFRRRWGWSICILRQKM